MSKKYKWVRVEIDDNNGQNTVDTPTEESVKDKVARIASITAQYIREGMKWVWDNKKEIGATAASLGAGWVWIKRQGNRTALEYDRYRQDHSYYDPRTGIRWTLRRELTNYERAELSRRTRSGEYTEDVLYDLGVLSR